MKVKKIYENFEDFEDQMKKYKPEEVFYSYTPKIEQAQTVKEVSGGKDAKGNDIVSQVNVTAQKTYYVISFCAQLKEDMFAFYYETTDVAFITSQQEFDEQAGIVKTTMDKLISDMQKNHPSSFLKKGVLQVD